MNDILQNFPNAGLPLQWRPSVNVNKQIFTICQVIRKVKSMRCDSKQYIDRPQLLIKLPVTLLFVM